jgi:hypothetical protein
MKSIPGYLRFPFLIFPAVVCIALPALLKSCSSAGTGENPIAEGVYLNHADSARYVGVEVCRSCHMDKFTSFKETGMGLSMEPASFQKSSADFTNAKVYDPHFDLWYRAHKTATDIFITEFRLSGKDTVHRRSEKVDYIIGSGQHTNSHLFSSNGYLYQMPMTYFTQEGKWDLPPGFENGGNTRFSRKIGLECISCHNAHPGFVAGSENKYLSVPTGINCERCHGPGSIHVDRMGKGKEVDTSKYIDYSIVNPGKLSADLQFDVCQRCHLQGNAVLAEGKSFTDFRPGMKLSEFMTVFLPRYSDSEDKFIMASHADRLKMSKCFLETAGKNTQADPLRPAKNTLTCVTCHNPHVSVKKTDKEYFNVKCMSCHPSGSHQKICSGREKEGEKANCISCHMPRSGSIDIPHVTVTDHFIRVPMKKTETEKIKTFIALQAVNHPNPSALTRAKAYIFQYEKFEKNPVYLDSAKYWIGKAGGEKVAALKVHLGFIEKDWKAISTLVEKEGEKIFLLSYVTDKSLDNAHAWTGYRAGEAYVNLGNPVKAIPFLAKAHELAPHHPDFLLKYANALFATGKRDEAHKFYEKLVGMEPSFAPGWCNAGFSFLSKGDAATAEKYYLKALQLDPDYEQVLVNLCGLYLGQKKKKEYEKVRFHLQKKYPGNPVLKQIPEKLPV